MITIDIETKSDKDISKCGVYAYADSPYFDILLFAYSVDGQPVQVVDTAKGEKIPAKILSALADEKIVKRAFNVNFERVCLSRYLRKNYPTYFQSYSINEDTVGDYLNPESWQCTMIHSRYLGLPSSLAEVGTVLGIEQQKMSEGKALIKFFCVPYAEKDGIPQFHNPRDYPDKWEIFKAYNKRDVEAEMEIDRKLSRFPVPDFIWSEFYLDQEINDRGILVDMELADAAITLDEQSKAKLTSEMQRLTGVENPNSVYQLLDWLEKQGYKSDSLGKAQVQELIKTAKEPVRSVLEMRLQLSKSSVKKYQAMEQAVCRDSRVRGMFSFYGASRTGRHCSKIIQLQNLPQNHLPDLSEARELVKSGDVEMVSLLYQQTNARLWRQGQKSETVIIQHIVTKGTVDEKILKALKEKDETQTALMTAVKAELEGKMDEGYKELAAAIVERAVWDYRNALKYRKKSEIHSLEKFFLSGWFELLSDYDGDEIMRIIRRDAPFNCSSECCTVMKKNPMKQYEKETGRVPIMATMASESRLRKEQWLIHGCNAFDAKRPRSHPMSFWTEQDVLQYIYTYKIPYAKEVYGDIYIDKNGLTDKSRKRLVKPHELWYN